MERTIAFRRVISAAAIAVAGVFTPIVAIAATAPAAQAATSRASIPMCTTRGLDIWMGKTSFDATGTLYYDLQFTNLSGHACVIQGFPGLVAVNMKGHPIGHAAVKVSASTSKTAPVLFTLKPLGQVSSTLEVTDPGHFATSTCKATTAAGLRVYPPQQTTAKIVPFPFLTCALSGDHDLIVTPVVKVPSIA